VLAASGVPEANAKDLLDVATKALGGGGGGRPDLAQGQGSDRAKIPEAIAAARARLESVLGR
jgi:alanyl-tRNA synthetase